MPISPMQKKIFQLLKNSRSPDSYVAGGTAIHRSEDSLRYSNDIDFFHDTDEAVSLAFDADRKVLQKNHYSFQVLISQPSFYRAIVSKGSEHLRLEWARDTAFRFFPVIEDSELGYRLHDIDLAINKSLALANRSVIRDAIDMLQIHKTVFSLAACCWAACGKDPGFTPTLLLDSIQRHSIFPPDQLKAEALAKPIDPIAFKAELMQQIEQARLIIAKLNPEDLGCIYIDTKGQAISNLEKVDYKKCSKHVGTIKGSWPRLYKE